MTFVGPRECCSALDLSAEVSVSLSEQFSINLVTALTVVVTTVAMYLSFVVLVRLVGPRSLTSTASFDFAAVVALGAVIGRTVLLADPTLAIGVVALVTLFVMQGVLGWLRQDPNVDRLVHRPPTLLVRDGVLLRANMRRVHVVEDEVRQAVRRSGARSLDEVRCVVLERNGAVSVVRSAEPVDPWVLEDVDRGRDA
jgi:uncharacterized membrane protein YcaP (DUF421 family)